MHIVLALLTAVGGIAWALYRLQNSGVNLNAFNPFHWQRRRKWQQQLGTRPVHNLQSPLEAAAVLVISMALLEGELTREQKRQVIQLFSEEFSISEEQALELYTALSHMLRNESNIIAEVPNILSPTLDQFSQSRRDSLLKMLRVVASSEGKPTEFQQEFLSAIENVFSHNEEESANW